MPDPLRIFLRLLGLAVFLGAVGLAALIMVLGADDFAREMGKECSHSRGMREEWCTWQDALGILEATPYVALVGAALLLVLGPGFGRKDPAPAIEPLTTGGRIQLGLAGMVVLLVVATFVGSFVYRAGYTAVTMVEVSKELKRASDRIDPTPTSSSTKTAEEQPAQAPRGLGRGSLLRPERFRRAMAEIRRASPQGARLSRLRVAADRIDAEVLGGGRVTTLRRAWDAKAVVVSRAPVADGDLPLVAFSRVDAAAPRRVTLATARAVGGRPRDVDYLVLQDVVGLRWHGFAAGGAGQVTASLDGRKA